MTKRTMVTCDIIGTLCVSHECSPILRFEVVLLQDHFKTPQLRDGKKELTITSLKVVRVLLVAGGKIEHLDVCNTLKFTSFKIELK